MRLRDYRTLQATPEANGRCETMEMHLFDTNARKENALCGAGTSGDDLRGVNGYLEDRLYGLSVGVACEGCKTLAVLFAENLVRDLEADGRVNEAEECGRLAGALLRETGS